MGQECHHEVFSHMGDSWEPLFPKLRCQPRDLHCNRASEDTRLLRLQLQSQTCDMMNSVQHHGLGAGLGQQPGTLESQCAVMRSHAEAGAHGRSLAGLRASAQAAHRTTLGKLGRSLGQRGLHGGPGDTASPGSHWPCSLQACASHATRLSLSALET